MNAPKPFAKIFTHSTLGQLLVQRSSNDEDVPGVRITFDPGVDALQPCEIFHAIGGLDDKKANQAADALFDRFGESMAIAAVQKQVELIKQMFNHPH